MQGRIDRQNWAPPLEEDVASEDRPAGSAANPAKAAGPIAAPAPPDPIEGWLASGLADARLLARGVCRHLTELGYSSLTEFTLRSGRRADVIAIEPGGRILIVEVKSSIQDFQTDRKWPEYLDFCDLFYFAVPAGFPRELIPPEVGLIAADAYDAQILRPSPHSKLNAARRKTLALRFAWTAAQRLTLLTDPR